MFDKLKADVLFLRGEYEAAAEMFREGAREGDTLASFNYAYCLWRGIGVEMNAAEAKSYFAFAKNMTGGEACYNLAMLYLHGEGVRCNYKLSFQYMCDAAELGCVEAMLYLGMVYTTGCMFEPDIVGISMIPFHKSEYRDFGAPLLAGDVPDFEEDEERRFSVVAPDAREAFLYFRKASRQDPTYTGDLVAKGKFLYAKCFLDGLGVDFDMQRGVRLMLMAGKSGSQDAQAFLGEHGITPEMLLGRGGKK
ncbi:MAG: sel1 repeat family protein [Clostridia bacterium]|nr:sel1 repeat family protein [Clostridia bacterium]